MITKNKRLICITVIFSTMSFSCSSLFYGDNITYYDKTKKSVINEYNDLASMEVRFLCNKYIAHTQYPDSLHGDIMTSFYFIKDSNGSEQIHTLRCNVDDFYYKLTDSTGKEIPVSHYYVIYGNKGNYFDCVQTMRLESNCAMAASKNDLLKLLNDKEKRNIAMFEVIINEPFFIRRPLTLEYKVTFSENGTVCATERKIELVERENRKTRDF